MSNSNNDDLKKRAIAELLEETKKASARAEVTKHVITLGKVYFLLSLR